MIHYGLLGTGLMGVPLGDRLLGAGYPLTVYNRTVRKTDPLARQGATVAPTPEAVLAAADVIVMMVTDAAAVAELVLGAESRSHLQGKTLVQMGTIGPDQSRNLMDQVTEAGGSYWEAPVLGSIPEARAGNLIVMVGSTPAQFEAGAPLLQCFSPQPHYIGQVGQAMALKLALNQLITGLTSTFALSLAFIQGQGVEVEQFMAIVRDSAVYAPTFDKKLSRMLEQNFSNPNFPTQHLLKDTRLFLDAAQGLGLETAGLAGVEPILERAIALGLGQSDYSALFAALRPPTEPH